ncbi:haloacid dehalogenase-like hydrolase [Pseudonocardia sp. KRD-184]|uniref:Haloacid dehalogenase-like hydrolase n=1 Tax=Pseudonocardia oceani TaxID=2792013 RepID=A0ABS6UHR5_9PSEU|nr:haloacid dehalogenase-like hydrolase [Pseudonocardia oceani]MBW0092482.1 haloacid dehalogenase-like hydrolase [Pseudonocardia oceani]MBW0100233.1 haloacid dehalogenase-like hydrolase [Pseudonocardia oceani]MBW0112946.1 haloacid dehalogenase-like hydrolase [Pseudonocardia oceani]MBW0123625.1 haloacid dehalogenase-like hydrolase [Pseudonocardia oceani]MBW0131458.1 haloacid dehalogenase-like hydrolase [Pseudonocardia oceani]
MRLIQWDVDKTLLVAGGLGVDAFAAAFTAVTGVPWRGALVAAGRTDLSITPELFARHGIDDAGPHLEPFFARYTAEFASRADQLPAHGTLLPGAAAVLAALAGRPGVVQTLVTGNIAAVGVAKVTAFGLHPHLDTAVGGYGDDHSVRTELVRRSRERAEAAYGPFADADVLVVGDTVHDVAAALGAGVVAVGVATGPATVEELTAAGAHHVLPGLDDVERAVAVLTG